MTISAPVTTTKVSNALLIGSHSVANLCGNTHSKINPNARFKPESFKSNVKLTEELRKSNNFGWKVPVFRMGDIPGTADKEVNMYRWQYLPPTGGESSPYRLGDFDGYNSTATSHLFELYIGNGKGTKPVVVPRDYVSSTPRFDYWAELNLNNGAEIKVSELGSTAGYFDNMYLTLIVASNRNHYGPSFQYSVWALSEYTVKLAVDMNLGSLKATVNTARFVEDAIVSPVFPLTISAVFLAPKMDGTDWLNGVSLKKDNLVTVIYNESYATYGDGGEGGDLPKHRVNITNAPLWTGGNIELYNSGGLLRAKAIGDVTFYFTNQYSAKGYLYAESIINELGISINWDGYLLLQGEERPNPSQGRISVAGSEKIIRNAQPSGGPYTITTTITGSTTLQVEGKTSSTISNVYIFDK